MGRQNDIVARATATHTRKKLCVAENLFVERRLVHPARFLCCARLDAAMHNRTRGTFTEMRFDFGVEQAEESNRLQLMPVALSF